MTIAVEPLVPAGSTDPVFVFSNHHSERFVRALAASSLEGGTAVFFPIGSVRDHGRAIAELAETPGWRVLTTFVSPPLVDAVDDGAVEYVPVRASAHAAFVRRRFADRPVVLVCHVPAATVDGARPFGLACPYAPLLFDEADVTVAATNDAIPVVSGPTAPVDAWDHVVAANEPLPTFRTGGSGAHGDIGSHVASLVPDGATIQLGIGSIPDAVATSLSGASGLSVHSGVVSDGLLDLVESDAVARDAGPALASQVVGETEGFYDRIERHESVRLASADRIHDPAVTGDAEAFVSINSAIEVDLSGQVNASHIGTTQYAAPGGILDFVEGAHRSPDGRSIVAMEARAKVDVPKIVPAIETGTPVDVPRTNVDYVVTEYGVATLVDRTPRERAAELIGVAHPDDRESLNAASDSKAADR